METDRYGNVKCEKCGQFYSAYCIGSGKTHPCHHCCPHEEMKLEISNDVSIDSNGDEAYFEFLVARCLRCEAVFDNQEELVAKYKLVRVSHGKDQP